MTKWRIGAPFLVAIGAFGGCVPSRDNPNDIANRPVSVLAVENGPFGTDGCGVSDSLDLRFSRGRCLHLSGRDSTDPQDDIVQYVFETRTDDGMAWTPLDGVGTLTSGHTLVLTPSELRSFTPTFDNDPSPVTHSVRLTVIDANGGASTTEAAEFQLFNSLPVLLQPGNRYVPAFGALWKRSPNPMGGDPIVGGGLTVRIESRGAIDEEGDPPQYCWLGASSLPHQRTDPCPAVPEDCLSTEPFIEQEIATSGMPDQNGRVEYFLQACDGNLWSRPVRASVVIQVPPAWAIESDFGRAVILDADQRTETFSYPVVGLPGFAVDPQDRVRALFAYDDPATFGKDRNLVRLQYVSDSAGGPVATATLDSDAIVRKVIQMPAAGAGWVVASIGSSGLGVYLLAGTSGTASVDGPWMLDPPVSVTDDDSIYTAVDPDTGDLWVSAVFEKYVWGLAPGGSISEIDRISLDDHVGNDHMVTGIGIREVSSGGNPVWIGHAPHVLVPGATGEPGIVVYSGPQQVVESRLYGVPDDLLDLVEGYSRTYGFGPYFTSPDTFFVLFFGDGVGFFGIKDGGVKLIDFTPTSVVGFAAAVHPASGELVLVSEGAQTIVRVSPEGSIASIETSEPVADVHPIARNTRVLSYLPEGDTAPARLILGQGTGVEGVTQRFPIPPLFGNSVPGPDYATGDLWVPSVIPIGAARFYADGRLADFVFAAADAANLTQQPFGAARHVASDPATGALWLVTVRDTSGHANVVWRVDPYGERALGAGVAANGGVDAIELALDDDVLAIAAQPMVESTSAALVMLVRTDNGDGTVDYSVQRMRSDGVFDPPSPTVLLTGVDEQLPQPAFMARDLVEPGVCVAVRNPLANQIVLRRYSPTLSSFSQFVQGTAGAPKILALAAFDEDCWLTFRQGGSIALGVARPGESFTPVGIALPGTSEPASIVPVFTADGIRPQKSHRVLVDFPDDDVIRRYALVTTGMGMSEVVIGIEEDEAFRTKGDVRLLTP